jgi:urease accessory protein
MSPTSTFVRIGLAAIAVLVPAVASAHIGMGGTAGFAQGFAHPLGGLDHVLAMVAVGTLAANLGGRTLLAVPLTFVTLMVAGGALGMAGASLPFVEASIALSVVVLGLMVAVRFEWPVAAAMALVGVFAIFHGHSHGTEMPVDTAGAEYALGFVTATGVLHLAGIGIGLGIAATGGRYTQRVTQAAGIVVAGVGVLFLGALL